MMTMPSASPQHNTLLLNLKPTSVALLLFFSLIIYFIFYRVLVVTVGGNRLGGHVINTMEFRRKYSRAQHSGVCD